MSIQRVYRRHIPAKTQTVIRRGMKVVRKILWVVEFMGLPIEELFYGVGIRVYDGTIGNTGADIDRWTKDVGIFIWGRQSITVRRRNGKAHIKSYCVAKKQQRWLVYNLNKRGPWAYDQESLIAALGGSR